MSLRNDMIFLVVHLFFKLGFPLYLRWEKGSNKEIRCSDGTKDSETLFGKAQTRG